VLERDVEQGNQVFDRCRRRIPDFSDKGIDFEQNAMLAFAHLRNFGLGPGCVDGGGELVIVVFELSPLLVQHRGGGLRTFSHGSSPLTDLDHMQAKIELLQRSDFVINAVEREKFVKRTGVTQVNGLAKEEAADMQRTFRLNRIAALFACARLDDHCLRAAP
jgi:hypothetical protein